MSYSSNLLSAISNYGGRQTDGQQSVKRFIPTIQNQVTWIYKKISTGETLITPADQKKNVLIPKDLIVEGSINNPSDIILKQNIEEISKGNCENILKLVPMEFIYKKDLSQKKHFGLIAQDIEKLYPDLVSNTSGYKAVNYIELIPILISQMKIMQEEINELKRKLKGF